jgi:hypothetical protein
MGLKPRRFAVFSAEDQNIATFPYFVREDDVFSPLDKSKAGNADQITPSQDEIAFFEERFWS